MSEALTFAWNQDQDHSVGDPRLQNNQFFEDRLHEAIEWELALRGIRRSDSSPDLLVHHHLSLADHEIEQETTDGEGNTRFETYTYEQGNIVVHLTNARTGRDVWVGWARANVEAALRSPENMRRWVYDLVRVMFESWPTGERQ